MILTVYGTTGELIKLAPVLVRLRARGHGYLSATTGQQVRQIPVFLDAFELPPPDLWLARGSGGRDLRSSRDIPIWAATAVATFARRSLGLRRELRRGPGRPLVLVHGDTMTTVLGALLGRALGVPVAHVEAGLRSFDLRNPFPEELNRLLASRLASIHYAPGAWAAGNLRRGRVVDTGSNTIRDSLALAATAPPPVGLPEPPFGVVSLHRFELLNDRRLLSETIELLAEHARIAPLLFVDHPVTVAALARFRLERLFDPARFVRVPRMTFVDFVPVMRQAAFVFTDSGGSQEECYYLDIPCLVHRRTTERREGLDENVLLSRYDAGVVRDFLADPARFRRRQALAPGSPSDVIVADLEAAGFV